LRRRWAPIRSPRPILTIDTNWRNYVGHWLRDLRSQFPNRELELVGVDLGHTLFPSAEEQKASGITLYDHNITKPFPDAWKNSFDIIHQRLLVWGLQTAAWPIAVKNYVDILKPGGVLHLVEAEFVSKTPVPDNLPQLQKQAALQVWATESFGMDIDIAYKMEALLSEAGLKDVQKMTFDYGFGALAVDPAQKNVSAEAFVECFRTVDTKIPGRFLDVATHNDQSPDTLQMKESRVLPRRLMSSTISSTSSRWRSSNTDTSRSSTSCMARKLKLSCTLFRGWRSGFIV
jgi:SAM-dependent methyltransferase